jgi:hypothetical protein
MRPMAAAAVGALISGVAFYAVGARAAQNNAYAEMPALVQTIDGRFIEVPNAKALGYMPGYAPGYAAAPGYTTALQPAAAPVVVRQTAPAPRQTVYRTVAPAQETYRTAVPAQERVVVEERATPQRSWAKTAMVIGGSSAAGAGVGGVMGGKKGALVGAAIGGGAASIYEATRRR